MSDLDACPLCNGPIAVVALNETGQWSYEDGSTVSVPMPHGVAGPLRVCLAAGTTWLRSKGGSLTRVGSQHAR
jgi:hypothetical protein